MTDTINVLDPDLILRFLINLIALAILLRGIYYNNTPNRDALFAFTVFGYGVFLVTALLHNVEMSMGFAFGLFAVFSLLRYRTEAISLRDMTYLFLVIVISLLSSVGPMSIVELIILNTLVCGLTALSETSWLAPKSQEKEIIYEKIDLIKPANKEALLKDLEFRTGLNIIKVDVQHINYLNDTARLRVFFRR